MELIVSTLRAVSYTIVEPSHLIVLFLMGIIFYSKNKRIALMQKMTLGESINSPLELTLSQIVIGIVAGAIGSIFIVLLGIVFDENSGIELLFLLSIIVLFTKKKFIKFAYTGAILGVLSIVFRYIPEYVDMNMFFNIDIGVLVAFIGAMYAVEGVLILLDGGRGAIPIFTKKKEGIIGGFAFNRYWPLPIAILFIISISNISSAGTVQMEVPNWWPLLNGNSIMKLISTAALVSIPLYGLVNYTEITFTKDKSVKPIYSGISTLIYASSLLLISQLAQKGLVFEVLAVLYIPLGYEILLRLGKVSEEKGKYLYISNDDGIAILDLANTSSAYEVGIRRGDKIVQLNNKTINSEVEAFKILKESILDVNVKVRKVSGELKEYQVKKKNKRIGILLVPKMVKAEETIHIDEIKIKKILDDIDKKSTK